MLNINPLAVRPECVEGRMANYDTASQGRGGNWVHHLIKTYSCLRAEALRRASVSFAVIRAIRFCFFDIFRSNLDRLDIGGDETMMTFIKYFFKGLEHR